VFSRKIVYIERAFLSLFCYKTIMMNVILTQDVVKLGRKHEAVRVKPGFALNYLLPQKLAIPATPKRLVSAEKKLAEILVQKERIIEKAEEIKKQLEALKSIKLKAKTTDKETLYGSISEKEIGEEIENQISVRLEKKHIKMSEHIKKIGKYKVAIRLAEGIAADIEVDVEAVK